MNIHDVTQILDNDLETHIRVRTTLAISLVDSSKRRGSRGLEHVVELKFGAADQPLY